MHVWTLSLWMSSLNYVCSDLLGCSLRSNLCENRTWTPDTLGRNILWRTNSMRPCMSPYLLASMFNVNDGTLVCELWEAFEFLSFFSTMSLRQWTAFVLWLATVLSVAGQNATTNVTQCIASYNWVPVFSPTVFHIIIWLIVTSDSPLIRWIRLPVLSRLIWRTPAVPVRFLYSFSLVNIP